MPVVAFSCLLMLGEYGFVNLVPKRPIPGSFILECTNSLK
jgi:hypothetical protein